jgi:magnesium-transporting ATPase (P-type)
MQTRRLSSVAVVASLVTYVPMPETVHLCAGDLAPADGAIFQKSDIAISEKMLTGETTLKHKGMYKFTGQEMPDEPVSVSPAVFAGTMVEVTDFS